MRAVAYPQGKVFDAAVQFARTQGTDPGARDGARHPGRDRRGAGGQGVAARSEVILFSYSGHGLLDLGAYDDYLHGRLIEE